MRMSMRCFTRLTNAFSKKVDNHKAAIALYFMHYNFARLHQSRGSPRPWRRALATTCGRSRRSWPSWTRSRQTEPLPGRRTGCRRAGRRGSFRSPRRRGGAMPNVAAHITGTVVRIEKKPG
jgi:hypothetical protein